MITFRQIIITCYNGIRFLANNSTILQKSTISENLRYITQEGNRQMIPPFRLFERQLFVTLILLFENNQNSFSCAPHGGSFWCARILVYLNFAQKLTTSTHAFLERKHPLNNSNPYCVLSPERLSAHGLHTKIIS